MAVWVQWSGCSMPCVGVSSRQSFVSKAYTNIDGSYNDGSDVDEW